MKKLFSVLMIMMMVALTACSEEEAKKPDDGGELVIQTDKTTATPTPTATPTEKPQAERPSGAPGGAVDEKDGVFEEKDLGITVNGVFLTTGMDFLPYVEEIGENPDILEGQACLEGGYDTNYYYEDEALSVYTYAKDGKQIIYNISVTSEAYPTDKGATVGVTTREELVEYYGEPTQSVLATDRYSLDGDTVEVAFMFEEGVLAGFDITDTGVH